MGHGYADYLQDFASLTELPKTKSQGRSRILNYFGWICNSVGCNLNFSYDNDYFMVNVLYGHKNTQSQVPFVKLNDGYGYFFHRYVYC